MATTATATDQLRKGARVTAAVDLRGVPEGTAGRVTMVSGLTWIRYWVRFENGVALGTVSRDKLITQEQLESDGAEDLADDVADDAVAGAGGGDDGGGAVATPSGTLVPQKLIDRSAAARARLGG
jgi:hypothetical protein